MYVKDENGIYKLVDKEEKPTNKQEPQIQEQKRMKSNTGVSTVTPVKNQPTEKETPLTAAMSIETRLSRLESVVFQGQGDKK